MLLGDLTRPPEPADRDETRTASVSARPDETVVLEALADIERFWSDTFPAVFGEAYRPIEGGFYAYGPEGDLPPCPGIDGYADIAHNAFYCPDVDLIAWDGPGLVAPLRRQLGDTTVALIMAHEVGHAVQVRIGFEGRSVTLEQQADCYAGAWLGSVAGGRSDVVATGPAELDAALGGMLELRDAPGVTGSDPDAHGSAFDRVAALQDGFDNGAVACAGYTDATVAARLVAVPFLERADEASGGNLPYDEIAGLTVADLEDYWSTAFAAAGRTWEPVAGAVPFDPDGGVPDCPGLDVEDGEFVGAAFYCERGDFVAWDDVGLGPDLYEEAGDFAVSTVIASQYSAAVQRRLGVDPADPAAVTGADCLTGTWAGSVFSRDRGRSQILLMSPGDLDEALRALLTTGRTPVGDDGAVTDRPSGFARVAAFRTGFVDGLAACVAPAGG